MRFDPIFVGRLLLPRLVAALTEAHDHALAPHGLTARQAMVLLSCEENEAGTPAELARLYGTEVSSISRLADRLERKGLLERVRSQTDRRMALLRPTAEGRRLVRIAQKVARPVADAAWHGVTKEERDVLATIVSKVMKNVEQLGAPQRKIYK